MEPVTVDLDDEARFGPEHVDEEALDEHVGLRLRQAGGADQRQEPALELGTRVAWSRLFKRSEQRLPAAVIRIASENRAHLAKVETFIAFGGFERQSQLLAVRDAGVVEQRAMKRGHRHPIVHRRLLRGQVARVVHPDSLQRTPSASGNNDFDRPGRRWPQPPMGDGGAVREHGLGPTAEHGRHPPSVGREACVADRVDPPANRK